MLSGRRLVGAHPGGETHWSADQAVRAVRGPAEPAGLLGRRRTRRQLTLAEAAVQADGLATSGAQRELAQLRAQWDDEVEAAARSADYRERAVAYRAIGQFRFRQKLELLRRGLEDESPAARGSALLSLELLSRDGPGPVNAVRPLLHGLVNADDNDAVRRLAIVSLRNGSPQRDTLVLLQGLAEDDEQGRELRATAASVAAALKKKADVTR